MVIISLSVSQKFGDVTQLHNQIKSKSNKINLIDENRNDSGKLWKTNKSVICTYVCSSQVESLVIDGDDIMITDPAKTSALFDTFFSFE